MKTVLIVDDEALFLASLTEGLAAYRDEFCVVTAGNGRQAVEAFEKNDISLVVTDLKMPVMDGFQLLAYLMSAHQDTPVIVMTAFGTPEIEDCIGMFEAYGYLEKPIDFQLLADTIRSGLNPATENRLTGITLFSFLQLLHAERKTCFLKIRSEGRKGTLYFSEGELLDATYKSLTGDAAVAEIINWQQAEVEIANIFIKLSRRVEKPFRQILMETIQRRTANKQSVDEVVGDILEQPEKLLSESLPNAAVNGDEAEPDFDAEFSRIFDSPEIVSAGDQPDAHKPQPKSTTNRKESQFNMANNVNESISELMQIDGAMAVALVDQRSGMLLGSAGSGLNLEIAAAGNSEVMRSKLKVMGNLALKDRIEDILISLTGQYHLMRPLVTQPNLFIYLVLNRTNANLAMARFKLSDIEGKIEV